MIDEHLASLRAVLASRQAGDLATAQLLVDQAAARIAKAKTTTSTRRRQWSPPSPPSPPRQVTAQEREAEARWEKAQAIVRADSMRILFEDGPL